MGVTGKTAGVVLLCAFGCSGSDSGSAQNAALELSEFELVDLTHSFGERTVYWPTEPVGFRKDTLAYGQTPSRFFYSAFAFAGPEHGGTHLDAPIHFAEGGITADRIPLDRLIAPAIVLLRTGWSRFWPDAHAYLGDDTPGDATQLRFPSFGEDAVRLLVRERRIAALGADVASIDYGRSTDYIVHRIAAENDVPGFENLTNLDRLPPTGATVFALPMKIEGGSGGPLRAVALVPHGR